MRIRGFFAKTIALVLVMLSISPLIIARADVLIEPNNDFYERNRDKMEYMGRNFYANGESGYIMLVIEPDSAREVISFKNGVIIYILFTIDMSGEVWGVADLNIQNEQVSGWIPMNQMYIVYDSDSFADENAANIKEQVFDLSTLDYDGDMIMWTWPGSGIIGGIWEVQGLESDTNMNEGHTIYTDEEGREWGYLSYFYGYRNFWVCLDDPSNPSIPEFHPAPEPNLFPAVDPPDADATASGSASNTSGTNQSDSAAESPGANQTGESGGSRAPSRFTSPMFIITLVSLVAMLSLVLINLLWVRKKRDKKDDSDGQI